MSETMTKRVPDSAESLLAAIDVLGPGGVRPRRRDRGRTSAATRPGGTAGELGLLRDAPAAQPRRCRGDAGRPPAAVEALSRADGSVGWTVMIGSSAWADMVHLPRATFDELFAEPGTVVAGAISPSGTAEAGRVRRLPGERPVGLRHRRGARDLGGTQLPVRRPGGWPARHAARGRSRRDAGRGRGHLAGQRAPRHRQPARPGRGVEVPATWTCDPMTGEACIDARDRAGAGAGARGPVRLPGRAGHRRRRARRHPGDRRRQGPAPGSRHARDQPRLPR